MNSSILMTALVATLLLSACDKTPVVVNVPPETVVVPGPAGPAGKPGVQGNEGVQGDTGKAGETGKSGDTTVIITPPCRTSPSKLILTTSYLGVHNVIRYHIVNYFNFNAHRRHSELVPQQKLGLWPKWWAWFNRHYFDCVSITRQNIAIQIPCAF